ncbi:MAG: AAA family ATPase [Bacteroidetes bacterium]|nr:AAA family ATPase [Bacteroidota bacterium]
MRNVPQDPIHHAEGDVWIHTRMVAEELTCLQGWQELPPRERTLLFWAALLHDVAKPFTTVVSENGRVGAPGHAPKGARLARQILWKGIPEPIPFSIREEIVALVKYHGAPLWNMGRKDSLKILLKAGLHCNLHQLALLAEADVRGRICADKDELLERIDFFREYAKEAQSYTQPYPFANALTRFTFFQKEDSYPDYVPYDDTWGEVILMSGLPGAGKDTWIQQNGGGLPVISLDEIRREMKVKPTDKQGAVIQAAKEKAREYLRAKQPFIWNATNITPVTRKPLVELFTTYKARVRIVYIETPYQTLMQQNEQREAIVPRDVIERMIRKWEVPDLVEAHEVEYLV